MQVQLRSFSSTTPINCAVFKVCVNMCIFLIEPSRCTCEEMNVCKAFACTLLVLPTGYRQKIYIDSALAALCLNGAHPDFYLSALNRFISCITAYLQQLPVTVQ